MMMERRATAAESKSRRKTVVDLERVSRSYWRGKEEVRVYDYVDRKVPMLARMFEKRLVACAKASLGFRSSARSALAATSAT